MGRRSTTRRPRPRRSRPCRSGRPRPTRPKPARRPCECGEAASRILLGGTPTVYAHNPVHQGAPPGTSGICAHSDGGTRAHVVSEARSLGARIGGEADKGGPGIRGGFSERRSVTPKRAPRSAHGLFGRRSYGTAARRAAPCCSRNRHESLAMAISRCSSGFGEPVRGREERAIEVLMSSSAGSTHAVRRAPRSVRAARRVCGVFITHPRRLCGLLTSVVGRSRMAPRR